MESVRVNRKLKSKLNYNFWQWSARVIPIVYLVGSLALYFIGTDTIVNIAACLALTVISFFAIAWWWWAMDTINEITQMFKTNMERYDTIHEEITEVRKEIQRQKKNK